MNDEAASVIASQAVQLHRAMVEIHQLRQEVAELKAKLPAETPAEAK